MTKLIVEIIENPDEKRGCWGIQIKPEGGTTFLILGIFMKGTELQIESSVKC